MSYWIPDGDTYRLFMSDVCIYRTALGGWKVVGGRLDGLVFGTRWQAQQAAEGAAPSVIDYGKEAGDGS